MLLYLYQEVGIEILFPCSVTSASFAKVYHSKGYLSICELPEFETILQRYLDFWISKDA